MNKFEIDLNLLSNSFKLSTFHTLHSNEIHVFDNICNLNLNSNFHFFFFKLKIDLKQLNL